MPSEQEAACVWTVKRTLWTARFVWMKQNFLKVNTFLPISTAYTLITS
jgi:hypothetical protein